MGRTELQFISIVIQLMTARVHMLGIRQLESATACRGVHTNLAIGYQK